MSYQRVIDALELHGLSWTDVDRIELREEAYDEFCDRASFDVSNYATDYRPAVRVTKRDERLVYVEEDGTEVVVNL